ncbi:hypothetical protein [Desulfosporosinus nitroreducens]|uniref:hypothetical protein n=1 Tax=Desulfosporosinus nitroreducens TaxID=2018668 RepID=UPI00207CCCC5|nr:hypothetical protein [Desulfosporosinus nitroreducens]MCO1599798.1 hypothetical protein [Desulfosporosinus nitroreducens]
MGNYIIWGICIGILYVVFKKIKTSRENKQKGIIARIDELVIVQGVPGAVEGQPAFLRLYDDTVTVNDQQTIPLARIKEAVSFSQKDIEGKNKSVVGRGIIGAALLGPLGAVVGGMSGVGQKNTDKTVGFIAIHYTDKDGIAETAILKTTGPGPLLLIKFTKALNEKLGIVPGTHKQAYEI